MQTNVAGVLALILWLLFLPTVLPLEQGYETLGIVYIAVAGLGIAAAIYTIRSRPRWQHALLGSAVLFLIVHLWQLYSYVAQHLASGTPMTGLQSFGFVLSSKIRLIAEMAGNGAIASSFVIAYFEFVMPVAQLIIAAVLLIQLLRPRHVSA